VGIDEVARANRLDRLRRWARAHRPELAAVAIGVLLRMSMGLWYDARLGFDYEDHWAYIRHVAERHALPPFDFNTTSYHPPLYYVIAGALVGVGLGEGALGWLAVAWGIVRLAVVWAALARWLPESRLARVVALALAAVLPVGVQLDGMISNETLAVLLSAVALAATPAALVAARSGRVVPAVGLGLAIGLALLTKVSAVVLVVAVAIGLVLDVVRGAEPWRQALRARIRPAAAGALVLGAVAGWFFARNAVNTGQLAPTGYEGWAKANQAPFATTPYLARRPPAFYIGWDPKIFVRPYYATGYDPPRFFPVLVASTFNDYYVYSFAGGGEYGAKRWLTGAAVTLGALSVVGGTAIALVTIIAWLAAWRALWRSRDNARLAVLAAAPLALLGQLHFATKYPNDNFGPIKGAYLQFVAPVLCAMFGVGVAWLWRRGGRVRAAAVLALAGLALVAAYTVFCRFPRFG
jgi:hypothetical protein